MLQIFGIFEADSIKQNEMKIEKYFKRIRKNM